jgi:hypothetical protein
MIDDGTALGLGPGHWYTGPGLGKAYVPSVTTILSRVVRDPELEKLREQLGRARSDDLLAAAGAFGTRVHELCAQTVGGDDIPLDEDDPVLNLIAEEYRTWAEQVLDEVVAVERPFVHAGELYGGTIDLIARFWGDSRPSVIDIKTSARLSPLYQLQTAAYREGAIAGLGLDVRRRVIVHIDKRKARDLRPGVIRVREYGGHANDWAAFRNAARLYRWLEEVNA